MSNVVLDVQELQTHLFTKWGVTRAVDGVSFQIREGETLGLVGESGSGKSMTALSLLRLLPEAARIVGGRILLDGDDMVRMRMSDVRQMRGRKISMILQDPQTALNPVFTIGNQLTESIAANRGRGEVPASAGMTEKGAGTTGVGAGTTGRGRQSVRERAVEVLRMMRVAAPERRLADYPHQMSGGMKQRVMGGIAIESHPQLLIADEPTTALDVTIQAQYLNLLKEVQRETGVAILFITHDLGVVARMCDRVAVMYAGRIVEQGSTHETVRQPVAPLHAGACSTPSRSMEERVERLTAIEGQPPALFALPQGCRFAARCPHVHDRCRGDRTRSEFTDAGGHTAACWLLEEQWKQTSSLKADNLQKHFPVTERAGADADGGVGARRGRHQLRGAARADARTRRRVRLREDDDRQAGAAPRNADRRPRSRSTAWTSTRSSGRELRRFRTQVQAVFQDPWSSLSPRMRVRGHRRGAAGGQPAA